MKEIQLPADKKIFFASDFHLGSVPLEKSSLREQAILRWMDQIKPEAHTLFLVGDLFDFWFEYRKAVPKGFTRFLGKLAELRDKNIDIQIFTGNHDLWMWDYFPTELQIPVHYQPIEFTVTSVYGTQSFLVGHGDGLGPGDYAYKNVLKPIFTNRALQFLFRWLHPDVGVSLAHAWAKHTRASKAGKPHEFYASDDKEWIYLYCKAVEAKQHHDYYVFGHRHLILDMAVTEHSRYLNIGDWLHKQSYASYDGQQLQMNIFENDPALLIPANFKK